MAAFVPDALLDHEWSLLIGGRLAPARSGRRYQDESPVTEKVIATVIGREESLEELLSYTQLKTLNIMLG